MKKQIEALVYSNEDWANKFEDDNDFLVLRMDSNNNFHCHYKREFSQALIGLLMLYSEPKVGLIACANFIAEHPEIVHVLNKMVKKIKQDKIVSNRKN